MFSFRNPYPTLFILLNILLSYNAYAQQKTTLLNVNGYVIETLTNPIADTLFSDDSVHSISKIIQYHPYPLYLNNEKLLGWVKQETESENQDLQKARYEYNAFLISKLEEKLKKLPNGYYNLEINNIIVDKKGNLIYYDLKPFSKDSIVNDENVTQKYPLREPIDPDTKTPLTHTIWQIVESALKRRTILMVNGAPTPYWFDVKQRIFLLNHELTVAY